MTPEFKLYTVCLTYNQPGYIVDTMNGFVIQKTDFPFLCLIIDDASTDGEQQVIRDYITDNFILESEQEKEYAHILSARHKTNQSCFFTVLFLKVNHGIGGKKRVISQNGWKMWNMRHFAKEMITG